MNTFDIVTLMTINIALVALVSILYGRYERSKRQTQHALDTLYAITHEYMVDYAVTRRIEPDQALHLTNVHKAVNLLKYHNHRGYKNLV